MIEPEAPVLTVGGRVLDGAQVMLPLDITIGREAPDKQQDANACQFTLLGAIPPEVRRGAEMSVQTGLPVGRWDDTWTDLWSAVRSQEGLLPGPDEFSQWQRVIGFTGGPPVATGSPENGGAVLVTQWVENGAVEAVWQGQPFDLSGGTQRTVKASARFRTDAQVRVGWEVLWSATETAPDYGLGDTQVIVAPTVTVTPSAVGEWVGGVVQVPDEAIAARLGFRLFPTGG